MPAYIREVIPRAMSQHAGTIALIGRPNAGKSSLLNKLVGERIAAVSHHPQTTRNRVVGIYTTGEGDNLFQAVLLDTPGIHEAWTPLNQTMVAIASSTLDEVDLVTWVVDVQPLVAAAKKNAPILDAGLAGVAELLVGRPHIVVLNKIDAVTEKEWLLPVIQAFEGRVVVPISAKKGDGVEVLTNAWRERLPAQEPLFDPELITDQPERVIVAELIREQVFQLTDQEVPYATAVEIERFDESERELGKVQIYARILVEKASQKAIVIGKGGAMIKEIRMRATKNVQALLGCKARLELFVAVEADWSSNPRMLKEMGLQAPKAGGRSAGKRKKR